MQLAIALGYKEIYLFGFDYICKEDLTHYHSGYGEKPLLFQKKLDVYYAYIHNAIVAHRKRYPDVKFYSCSKNSRLNKIIPYEGGKL